MNSFKNYISAVKTWLAILVFFLLTWMSILILMRICFTALYVPFDSFVHNSSAMPLMVFNILRFDAQTASYCLMTVLLLWIPLMFCDKWPFGKKVCSALNAWFVVVTVVLTALSIADMAFYRYFSSHFNQTALDFFDEGPVSLLVSIWNEYPVLWMAFGVLVAIVVFRFLGRRVCMIIMQSPRPAPISIWGRLGLFLFVAAIQFLLMRGSVGQNPLQPEDLVVSSSRIINDVVPNATYMLKKAISERSEATSSLPTEEALKKYGFDNIGEALTTFSEGLGRNITIETNQLETKDEILDSISKVLYTDFHTDWREESPNVVFVISESWSEYLAEYLEDKNILLPKMGKHLQEDLWWKDFCSVRNGTEMSLSTLLAAVPYKCFCMSKQSLKPVPTSIARFFKESGYLTTFVTGMNNGWANLNNVIPAQGFDSFLSKYEMLETHPNYRFCDVGVYDHFMFETIFEHLSTSTKKPKFIMALTTTNHPPLQLPKDIDLPPLPSSLLKSKQFTGGEEVISKYLKGFQYANYCMGSFMDKLKSSPLADNTVVVFTGDHNVRSIFNYNMVSEQWMYRVPLYMYIPERYRPEDINTQVFADHYDILSTLANLCLNSRCLNIGRNLLSDRPALIVNCAYNENGILCTEEDKQRSERFCASREALLHILFSSLE